MLLFMLFSRDVKAGKGINKKLKLFEITKAFL